MESSDKQDQDSCSSELVIIILNMVELEICIQPSVMK